jgi:hypothetical protein
MIMGIMANLYGSLLDFLAHEQFGSEKRKYFEEILKGDEPW